MVVVIGDTIFVNPILNASGCWCLTYDQIKNIEKTNNGGIVSKTCTLNGKQVAKQPNYIDLGDVKLNCMGLPNLGYYYYKNIQRYITKKPFIMSINGDKLDDLLFMLGDYDKYIGKKYNIKHLVEINVGCPNLNDDIVGYHSNSIDKILYNIKNLDLKHIYIGLKLPPYFEKSKIKKLAKIFKYYQSFLKFIVCSNSIPNGLYLKDAKPYLSETYGGVSGKLNKYIALSNVHQFYKLLDRKIKIIGCGGITSIHDVQDYFSCGAEMVQIGSELLNDDNIMNKLVAKL